ncbi:unnamed protein product [Schistocephalus solidus]|uniref:Uncharacterized protein n=1 Tax=Schistocephalus solidus TaxID=70667 RepID=A0A183T9D2_SCHSO|nr:unnamed protein product [Schistocephalus solidus]
MPRQPPASSPASGLLDCVSTPDQGMIDSSAKKVVPHLRGLIAAVNLPRGLILGCVDVLCLDCLLLPLLICHRKLHPLFRSRHPTVGLFRTRLEPQRHTTTLLTVTSRSEAATPSLLQIRLAVETRTSLALNPPGFSNIIGPLPVLFFSGEREGTATPGVRANDIDVIIIIRPPPPVDPCERSLQRTRNQQLLQT